MKLLTFILIASLVVAVATVTTQMTFFVVQPIGALPKGITLVIWRPNTMKLIDSADAWCDRQVGSVSLICRAAILANVAKQEEILIRLPYSETLYLWSTDGLTYSR